VSPRRACTIAAALLLFGADLLPAADPDFTGEWKMDHASSELRALPRLPAERLSIDHRGTRIRATEHRPGELSVSAEFTTDRKETVSKAGGGTTQSVISKWEGTALLVNTLVRSPGGQYTVMDRWKLSRDRQRLTVRRQVIQLHGEMEFTLVYERVPAGNPAITRPRNGRQGS
jgi:hypothetical protein